MTKISKKTVDARKTVERETIYSVKDAFNILDTFPKRNFDESVDIAFHLGVDTKKADQALRGTIPLPHGTGKTISIAVFAAGEEAMQAKEAGADIVGDDDLVKQIEKGEIDVDLIISTPEMMAKVGRLGKVLGPKGLMPNPKTGTVTADPGKAVKEFKAGKVEYRTDKNANVHVNIGKISFTREQLLENYFAVIDEILRAKPAASSGKYIQNISISRTMSPGIKVDTHELKPAE
jgi:large subunit ribosomal protein L1